MHETGKAKESPDVGEGLARGPIANARDLGVIWNAAVVIALVPKDDDLGACDDNLLGGDCGCSTAEAVEDAMDVLEEFPDELADVEILWNGLIVTVFSLVAGLRSFDGGVIHGCVGNLRNLWG